MRPVQPLRSIMQQRPLTPQALANLRRAYEMFDTARYTDMDYNTKMAKLPDLLMIHASDLIHTAERDLNLQG